MRQPEGAFYVFPDVRGLFGRPLGPQGARGAVRPQSCARICWTMRWSVTVPGEAFGTPGFVRFSYALAMDQLQEGVARVQEALKAS